MRVEDLIRERLVALAPESVAIEDIGADPRNCACLLMIFEEVPTLDSMTVASSSLGARRWLANRSSLCEREVRLR